MSDQFRAKIERSSFGTQSAKAARRSVPSTKARSLVARSMKGSTAGKFRSGGGEVSSGGCIPRCRVIGQKEWMGSRVSRGMAG